MVLSTTKRTSSISSIVNQNQGGGPKKAGFPYIVGRESWTTVHLNESGTSQLLGKSDGSLGILTNSNSVCGPTAF